MQMKLYDVRKSQQENNAKKDKNTKINLPRPESRSDVDPAAALEGVGYGAEEHEGVCSCAGSGLCPGGTSNERTLTMIL